MPPVALIAVKPHRYNGRQLYPGMAFTAKSQSDAKILKALRRAVDDPSCVGFYEQSRSSVVPPEGGQEDTVESPQPTADVTDTPALEESVDGDTDTSTVVPNGESVESDQPPPRKRRKSRKRADAEESDESEDAEG